MRKCPTCNKTYDDSWGVCLQCNETLIQGEKDQNKTPSVVKEVSENQAKIRKSLFIIGVVCFCIALITTLIFALTMIGNTLTQHGGKISPKMFLISASGIIAFLGANTWTYASAVLIFIATFISRNKVMERLLFVLIILIALGWAMAISVVVPIYQQAKQHAYQKQAE